MSRSSRQSATDATGGTTDPIFPFDAGLQCFCNYSTLTVSTLTAAATADVQLNNLTPIAKRFTPARTSEPKTRINDRIRALTVRVVDPEGKHGIYTLDEAIELAKRFDMDLVEIAPNTDPPVCKIVDFGKYRYEVQKKQKEAKKKQHSVTLKEIRFRPHTDTHDFDFKTRHAREFLEQGHKVKAWVQFRGRDIVYKESGKELLDRFTETLQDVSKIDQPAKMEGRRMTTVLSPSKK